jgi:hypothetical protein
MTDSNSIINAVKRLERVGGEHSKATEKLFKACSEVADFLLQNVPPNVWFGEFGYIVPSLDNPSPGKARIYEVRYHRRWDTDPYDGYQLERKGEVIARNNVATDWTRDTAMAFANDVANGLLYDAINAIGTESERLGIAATTVEDQIARLKVEA